MTRPPAGSRQAIHQRRRFRSPAHEAAVDLLRTADEVAWRGASARCSRPAALVCVAATVIPLKIALRKMEEFEF